MDLNNIGKLFTSKYLERGKYSTERPFDDFSSAIEVPNCHFKIVSLYLKAKISS